MKIKISMNIKKLLYFSCIFLSLKSAQIPGPLIQSGTLQGGRYLWNAGLDFSARCARSSWAWWGNNRADAGNSPQEPRRHRVDAQRKNREPSEPCIRGQPLNYLFHNLIHFGELLHALGLDHRKLTYPHDGRDDSLTDSVITDANPVRELLT